MRRLPRWCSGFAGTDERLPAASVDVVTGHRRHRDRYVAGADHGVQRVVHRLATYRSRWRRCPVTTSTLAAGSRSSVPAEARTPPWQAPHSACSPSDHVGLKRSGRLRRFCRDDVESSLCIDNLGYGYAEPVPLCQPARIVIGQHETLPALSS